MAKKNKKKEYYDISGVVLDTKGNQIGTMKVPTIAEREERQKQISKTAPAMAAVNENPKVQDFRTVDTVKSLKETQKNLNEAEDKLNIKTLERQKQEADIYKKAGQKFGAQFEKPGSQKLTYESKSKKMTALPEQKITREEVEKKVAPALKEEERAFDKWKIANYENNLAKVNEEDVTVWDKSGGRFFRGLEDMFSPLVEGDSNVIEDEKGNKTFLPSYNSLKQQAVRNSYGNDLIGKVASFGGDILETGGKILGAATLDVPTGGIGGKALYWTDMATDNYKNLKNEGYSNEQAAKNTIISTGSEFLTEKMLGGLSKTLTGGKASKLESTLNKKLEEVVKKPGVTKVLGQMTSEGIEEFLQDWIGAVNDKITLNKDIDVAETAANSLYSGLLGAGTAGFVSGSLNTPNAVGTLFAKQSDPVQKVQNLNEVEKEALTEIHQKVKSGEPLTQENVSTLQYLNNKEISPEDIANQRVQQLQFAVENGEMALEDATNEINAINEQIRPMKPVDTDDKVLNFRNSVENANIEDPAGFYKSFEKIIQDKDYNVILDSSITNEKGNPVNAVISNENGITIKVNPKSERAAEILLMHEVTHGIETKEISNLIMDYASKNSEFNTALEDLKKAYGTEDVTPEVVADISGQLLGNQEFINNLSVEKPNLFQRIYEKIVELKNKLTGNSNEARFIRDLEVKWRKAYRNADIKSAQQNLKEGSKYSQNAEIYDNDGNKLSKEQEEFFDESKVRDDEGHLIKVYHTTTDSVTQFNEFDPVGTRGYNKKFGDQTVNFFTNSKYMSGSYANQRYEMADTKKLNNIQEAQQWLDKIGVGDITIEGNNVYEGNEQPFLKYDSEKDLLRNLKNDIQEEYGNKKKLQYEGYLNIKNPFVVDVGGEEWNAISKSVVEGIPEEINKAEKYKEELHKLVEESKKKYETNGIKAKYLGKTLDKMWASVTNEDFADLYQTGFIGINDDYEGLYKSASEHGFELPEPNTKMKDIIDKNLVSEIEKTKWTSEKEMLNWTIKDAFEKTNKFLEDVTNFENESTWFEKNYKNIIGDEVKTNVLDAYDWYELSNDKFSPLAKDRADTGELQTNDVIAYIISENKTKLEEQKYDGVIFKNVMDYAGHEYSENGSPAEDVYVTFNSNQFKAADNLNPTSDQDIRYSKKADRWQKFLDKYFASRGTTTKFKEKAANISKPVENKQTTGEPSVNTKEFKQAQQKIKNGTATMKERKYVKTAAEAQNTQKIVEEMDDVSKNYEVISNEKSMKQAKTQLSSYKTVEDKAKYVEGLLTSGKRITAADMTAAELVLKDAAATGNKELYKNVLADASILATEYGQVIQALSQIRKLSPTSQLDVLEKIIKREKAKGNKAYENLEITDNMRDRILDCYDSNGNVNQEQFDNTMEEIKQELADNMKVSAGDKVRAWRYLSMLGNPKTHVRNMVANVAMTLVKSGKDLTSAVGQDIFIRDKAKKTATLRLASKEVKDLAKETYKEVSGDTFGNKYNEKSDLENRQKVYNLRALEELRKFNDKALSVEDQAFKKINYKKAFSNYLTAQGISTKEDIKNNPQIVEKAKIFAVQEANVATFNQKNKLSEFINSADNKLGTTGKVIRGAVIPFTRTPLNIARTGIEYTPGLGLTTTISDVKKAPNDMKGAVLIDGLSKQITGASLALIGYALAKSGLVTSSSDDDKDDQFEKDMGASMDYSIKIGNDSYDLSWLSPSSMPFFVGARMFEVLDKQEGFDENIILESIASTLDPLSEMSVIQSFTDVLSSYSQKGTGKIKDMGITTLQNYLSQFVPTVSGQFARLFDSTKRTSSADASAPNKISQETYRKLAYKIPGLRNTLPASTDYYGRKKAETNDIFNAFLSPANKKKDTMSEEDKEIVRLYNKTGNDKIVPAALSLNVKYNDNNYKMTRKEYNKYKKDFGDAFTKNVKQLMASYEYENANDEERADMIAGIMDYSKDKAKDNFLTKEGEDYSGKSDDVDNFVSDKMGISDYYALKVSSTVQVGEGTTSIVNGKNALKNIALVDAFGIDAKDYLTYSYELGKIRTDNGKRGTAKKKKIEYINSLPLSAVQKQMLYSLKVNTSKKERANNQVVQMINDSDLSYDEKQELYNYIYK